MRVALVASSFLPEPGRLERRVDQLARGLARHGAEVEILTQGPVRASVQHRDGVTTRTFPAVAGPLRFAVAPRLRERLRLASHKFDVIDVHTRQAPLALAVASARVRRLVLSPCASTEAFLGWPHTRATRAMLAAAPRIVCRSEIERDLLCRTIPQAASRTVVVPDGVDLEAIRSAEPFDVSGTVVLAVDRLNRSTGVGRAIAAMASLDPEFRLVVVGDGPTRDRLQAFADDLRVSSRIQFTGSVSDAILHRWLCTARVVVSLPGERSSGTAVTEACAAGVSVVASDLPIQRQAAERGGGGVIFVAPRGSPLDVADAIEEASQLSVIPNQDLLTSAATSWDASIDATWDLYEELLGTPHPSERGGGVKELAGLSSQLDAGRLVPPTPLGHAPSAAGDPSWWPTRGRTAHRVSGERRWP
ncbi:MAG: glycosyltransferase family 4 protein [Solirubrobacteraceae bacterium]